MEKVRKGYEILDEKISPDNVMRIGELLALSALKFMCGHKGTVLRRQSTLRL